MKATIKINMDNAAFEEPNGVELAKILWNVRKHIVDGCHFTGGERASIFDSNGNNVGEIKFTK